MTDTPEDFDPVQLLLDQYQVLGHEGLGYTEIRIPKKGIQVFVQGQEQFMREAAKYNKSDVYVGINPRKTQSGKEEDVSYVTCIVIDCDPIRPKDTPSSDAQHQEAIEVAGRIRSEYDGLLVSSGSGAHVYIPVEPIPVVDVKGVAESLRNFSYEVKKKYETATIKVDSIFDLPRIIRCWGSQNTKSNRPCYFLTGTYARRKFILSDYRTPVAVAGGSGVSVGASGMGGVPAEAGGTEEKFKRALDSNPSLRKIIDGASRYPSRSEADFAFIAALLRGGFTVPETVYLAPQNPYGKAAERKGSDLEREVLRVYDKIKATIPKPEVIWTPEDYIKDLSNRKPGIQTGFTRWDSMTAGLKPGRYYVVAGRPTEGKTTYLVQQAVGVAVQGPRVLYFPTECARTSIIDKMLSAQAKVNLRKFQFGDFTTDERDRIQAVLPGVLKLPITVVENFTLKMPDIIRAVDKYSPDYVIVDFLHGMSYNDVNSSSELGAVVMGVKELCQKRSIPITLAAQLHRRDPKLEDSLSDLKGTGKLEEEGDVITFIRTTDPTTLPAKAKAHILKNKYGEPGLIPMTFDRGWCTFKEDPIENHSTTPAPVGSVPRDCPSNR